MATRHVHERIDHYNVCDRRVHNRRVVFLVEHTHEEMYHACTVDDVATVLAALPRKDVPHDTCEDDDLGDEFELGVVLFQPTKKTNILASAWGRLRYAAEPGKLGRPAFAGPAIYLSASRFPLQARWSRRLSVDEQAELARLRPDATQVESDSRHHHLTFELEGVRRVQLYRTLLHEVGHWVDYYRRVDCADASEDGEDWESLWEKYCQHPTSEGEAAAHRYADATRQRLESEGVIPFARKLDPEIIVADGLRTADFAPET